MNGDREILIRNAILTASALAVAASALYAPGFDGVQRAAVSTGCVTFIGGLWMHSGRATPEVVLDREIVLRNLILSVGAFALAICAMFATGLEGVQRAAAATGALSFVAGLWIRSGRPREDGQLGPGPGGHT